SWVATKGSSPRAGSGSAGGASGAWASSCGTGPAACARAAVPAPVPKTVATMAAIRKLAVRMGRKSCKRVVARQLKRSAQRLAVAVNAVFTQRHPGAGEQAQRRHHQRVFTRQHPCREGGLVVAG